MPSVNVSVIATVFNERAHIDRLLDSLAAQTRLPDEVVICDGGSRDGTAEWIRAYAERHPGRLPNLRVLEVPGANISRGRNCAIEAAAGPIIAVTDAGVRLSAEWLEQLMLPWEQPGDPPVGVAGFFTPDVQGVFETAMAATVLPLQDDIDPASFLPSSRSVAFTKAAWQATGGYPEWLDYSEDLVFDLKLNALRPRARLGVCMGAACACLLQAAHEPWRLLEAVLSLRTRRWQGGPLAQAPRCALCHVWIVAAAAAGPRALGDVCALVGMAGADCRVVYLLPQTSCAPAEPARES